MKYFSSVVVVYQSIIQNSVRSYELELNGSAYSEMYDSSFER